ncbi:MAG: UDP-N-acetylmuramate--L-alanine ligase [Magnetococcales bacterium]|nr:UDP-N-acetylmuramate--L-alanine ligase [Magnetococcales bacterium]
MYKKINKLHFVGIGGIGMSGIAEVLLNLGYKVSGSDLSENANVKRLKIRGAEIFIGHDGQNVAGADAVVVSSAVKHDNPEVRSARRRRIPVVPRAEMLAELMRLKYGVAIAGTHGKTTTTSLAATLLAEAELDPTVVNGGIVKAFGSNARLGKGEFLVTEADESDGSFLKLNPTIAVVTNIDPEHMEHYGDFSAVREAFRRFVEKIPFYGLAVLCRDHPESAALQHHLSGRRVVTYGLKEGADYHATELRFDGPRTRFRVTYRDPGHRRVQDLGEVDLALPGEHNVNNTLAAIAVARELDVPWGVIAQGLANFAGVGRRFDVVWSGRDRVVIDDYGHHPVEIKATLAAARGCFGAERRVVVIFQPHRYTRVRDLLEEFLAAFGDADLALVQRIYPAGEKPLPGILSDGGQAALVTGIRAKSQISAQRAPEGEGWMEELETLLQPGDVTLFLGAGDVSAQCRAFAARCQEQESAERGG